MINRDRKPARDRGLGGSSEGRTGCHGRGCSRCARGGVGSMPCPSLGRPPPLPEVTEPPETVLAKELLRLGIAMGRVDNVLAGRPAAARVVAHGASTNGGGANRRPPEGGQAGDGQTSDRTQDADGQAPEAHEAGGKAPEGDNTPGQATEGQDAGGEIPDGDDSP